MTKAKDQPKDVTEALNLLNGVMDMVADDTTDLATTGLSGMGDLFANLLDDCQLIETDELQDPDGNPYKLAAMSTREFAGKSYKMLRKGKYGWLSGELANNLSNDSDLDYAWATGSSPVCEVRHDDIIKDSMVFVPIGAFHYRLLQLSDKFKPSPFSELVGFYVPTYQQLTGEPLPLMSFLSPVSQFGSDPVADLVKSAFKQAVSNYVKEGNDISQFTTSEKGQLARFTAFTKAVQLKLVTRETAYGMSAVLRITPISDNNPLHTTHAIKGVESLARLWLSANNYTVPEDAKMREREAEALAM